MGEEMAHSNRQGLEGRERQVVSERSSKRAARTGRSLPDSNNQNESALPINEISRFGLSQCRESTGWDVEPNVGRVADGVPARVDRLKSLGNAVVPQIAEWIGRRIIEAEERLTA